MVRPNLKEHAHMLTSCLSRDAWAKHKDLSPQEAKVMYVEALIKVKHHAHFECSSVDVSFLGSSKIF